jgi:hypothetical protein
MFFHRTERQQYGPGPLEPGFKFGHGHFFNDHRAPSIRCICGITRTSGRRAEAAS